MKGHVKKNILIGYIQDNMNVRRAMAVKTHIDTCDLCRQNFVILKEATTVSKSKKIKPGRSVLAGILDYYDNYKRPTERVQIPKRLSAREKELLEELARVSSFRPRG